MNPFLSLKNRIFIYIFAFICLLLIKADKLEAISGGSEPVPESKKYWVHFRDKGNYEFLGKDSLETVAWENGVSELARKRRINEGITTDSLYTLDDLPPAPEYLNHLESLGFAIRRTSCWFNLASIECSPELKSILEELPFVDYVHELQPLQTAAYSYEEVGSWEGFPPPGPGKDLPGSYGPSYLQALQVNAVEAHRQGYTGKGSLMLVLDSGFELSHEAFRDIDVFASYDFVMDDDQPGVENEDKSGQAAHGTGCLSVIAGYSPGNLIGIAYESTFILAKTEDTRRENIIEEDNFVAAVEWAERMGANILSASLSYKDWYEFRDYDGQKPFITQSINRARKLGMLCVTSNGNEGPQFMTLGAPADSYGGMGGGAVDSTGKIARFSSRGPTGDGRIKPDLVAMGVRTACVRPFTEHDYSRWNGTSLSTPVLGGVIALVRGAHPNWSANKTERALKTTASRADRPDNIYGCGIPDVMAAIRYPEIKFLFLNAEGYPIDQVQVILNKKESEIQEEREPERQQTSKRGLVSYANLSEGTWKYEINLPEGFSLKDELHSGEHQVGDGLFKRFQLISN